MVVHKEQAKVIYDNIKGHGGVVEYKLYPGEGHGWQKEENMRDACERELAFYERILKLKQAQQIIVGAGQEGRYISNICNF